MEGALCVFAIGELDMTLEEVIWAFSVHAAVAVLSNQFIVHVVIEKWEMSGKMILVICSFFIGLIPIYGIVGFQSRMAVYIVFGIVGLFGAPFWGVGRSTFSPLVPPNREAAFFALYQVT